MEKLFDTNRVRLYPLSDPAFRTETDSMGLQIISTFANKYLHKESNSECNLYVIATEFREPKEGEWYISGAIPEAYKAPNNLSQKYWCGKLVAVKEVKKLEIIEG